MALQFAFDVEHHTVLYSNWYVVHLRFSKFCIKVIKILVWLDLVLD